MITMIIMMVIIMLPRHKMIISKAENHQYHNDQHDHIDHHDNNDHNAHVPKTYHDYQGQIFRITMIAMIDYHYDLN